LCGEMRDRPLHYPTRPPCVHTLQRSNTVSRAAMLVRPRRAKGAHHSSSGSYLEEIHWVPYDTSPPSECCGVESGRAPSSEPPGAGGETISYTLSTIKRTDALGVQEKEPKSRPQGRSSCFRSSRLGCRVGLHHLSQDTGSADPYVLAISLQDRRTPPTPRMEEEALLHLHGLSQASGAVQASRRVRPKRARPRKHSDLHALVGHEHSASTCRVGATG